MDRTGYPRNINDPQTFRRRPHQRVKQKQKLSGKFLQWPKLKKTILLGKFTLWRTLRVCAWIGRFIYNARSTRSNRSKGPLTTEEVCKQRIFWLKRVQDYFKTDERFEEDRLQLNLQPNENGLLECRGRIQGVYPIIYQNRTSLRASLLKKATTHGGVSLTMAKIRERYWVLRLRRLARKVVKACNGCKRFHATAFINPPPGKLPKDRTEGQNAFQVIGVDFVGPLKFRKKKGQDGKAYLVLYACSLTRGIILSYCQAWKLLNF